MAWRTTTIQHERAVKFDFHTDHKRVEQREAQLVLAPDPAVAYPREDLAPLRRPVVVARELLLQLRHVHERVRLDQARELRDQRHVLGHVERLRPERRIPL